MSLPARVSRRRVLTLGSAGLAAAAAVMGGLAGAEVERLVPEHGRYAVPDGPQATANEAQVVWNLESTDSIALTFDDGPDPRWTPHVLDALAQHRAKATFFMVGERAVAHPDLVRRVVAEGHEIGNHTFSHRDLSSIRDPLVRRQIVDGHYAISGIAERAPTLLRPPWGRVDPVGLLEAARLDYSVIMWSLQISGRHVSQDYEHCRKDIRPGAIVLLHDGGPTPTDELMDCVRRLLYDVRGRLRCRTVSAMLEASV